MIDFQNFLIYETSKNAVKPRFFYNFNMPKNSNKRRLFYNFYMLKNANKRRFFAIIILKTGKNGLKQSKTENSIF